MSELSDTQTIQDVDQTFTEAYSKSQRTIQTLQHFKQSLTESKVFDGEDVKNVQIEIERLNNNEVARYRALSLERLKILKQFDDQLNLKKNHPVLNRYFVNKQNEIMKLLQQ